MLDIVGKRFWFFLISGILILIAVISLATFGLKPSIEFSSGSILTLKFDTPVEYNLFQQEMNTLGYNDAIIQRLGTGDFLIGALGVLSCLPGDYYRVLGGYGFAIEVIQPGNY